MSVSADLSEHTVHPASHAPRMGAWPKIAFFILFAYMAISPFYIFPSGYPQPADFLLALGVATGFILSLARFRSRIQPAYLIALGFGVYAFTINMAHYVFYPDIRLLLSSMIYVYNVAAFIFISSMLKKYPAYGFRILFLGIAAALAVQLVHIQFLPSSHPFRATGAFNNPNQLAYWSLLICSVLVLIKYRVQLGLFDYALLGIAFYIQLESLSKAGIITTCLLFVFCVFSRAVKDQHRILALFAALLIGVAMVFQFSNILTRAVESDVIQRSVARIASIGEEADDSLEGRGYYRVFANPVFLALGAGEGAFWRYDKDGYNHELHSGLATLVFAYGPVGAMIFVALLYAVFKGRGWFFLFVLLNVMLFGATHQNIRFAMFWVFLAAVEGLPRPIKSPKIEDQKDAPA